MRRWLDAAVETALLSDQDTEPPDHGDEQDGQSDATRYRDPPGRVYVVRVTGRDDGEVITADQIQPGDLIVVPIEYGGCDRYGWHPTSTTRAVDVADLADRRGRPTLRLNPYLRTVIDTYQTGFTGHATLDAVLAWAKSQAELDDGAGDENPIEEHIRTLTEALNASGGGRLARNLTLLIEKGATRRPAVWCDVTPWFLELLVPTGAFADDQSANASSITRQRTPLDDHQRAVAARAAEFARNLTLTSLLDDIRLAALLHDEGKRDPRFQVVLWGGDHWQAEIAGFLLAKSGMDPSDRAAHRRSQERSGYPRGMRHEALSAQIAAYRAQVLGCTDPDLVIHLVAAHHGYSRPLLPPVTDDAPQILAIDDRNYSRRPPWTGNHQPGSHGETNGTAGGAWPGSKPSCAWPTSGAQPATRQSRRQTTPTDVHLPALDGQLPLGFLAALGVLRVLSEHTDADVQLRFDEDTAAAVLTGPYPDLDAVAEALTDIATTADGLVPGLDPIPVT